MSHDKTEDGTSRLPSATGSALCPGCGSIPKDGWVGGWRGWICGSSNQAHAWEKPNFVQSKECYAMHWQTRALKAEARVRELEAPNVAGEPRRSQDL